MINRKLLIFIFVDIVIVACIFLFLFKHAAKQEEKVTQAKEQKIANVPNNSVAENNLESPDPLVAESELPPPKNFAAETKVKKDFPNIRGAIIPLDDPVPDDDFSVYVDEALQTFRLNSSEEEKEKMLEDMIAINHPMIVPVILLALDDDNEHIRSLAAEALKFINHPDVIPAVEKALNDKDSEIRQDALGALMHIDDENITTAMTTALDDCEEGVRETVFEIMLMQDSPKLIPVAEAALKSSYVDNQLNAIGALEDIPAPEAIDTIINLGLLSSFDSAREQAIDSLQNISGQKFTAYEDWNKWWKSIRHECPTDGDMDSWDKWWFEKRKK